jgi:hypothetical protein
MGSNFIKPIHLFPSHPTDPEETRNCPTFQSIMRAVKIRRAMKRGIKDVQL